MNKGNEYMQKAERFWAMAATCGNGDQSAMLIKEAKMLEKLAKAAFRK